MKVCVVSDTHGKIDQVVAHIKANHYDQIWHLGDYVSDGQEIENKTGIETIVVKGNCDPSSSVSEIQLLTYQGKRFFLVHGHQYGVKYNLNNLFYTALENQVDLICYGHTHMPVSLCEQGVRIFNPGSASLPRGGSVASIGCITINQGEIDCIHINI